jgi:hypothetical protein
MIGSLLKIEDSIRLSAEGKAHEILRKKPRFLVSSIMVHLEHSKDYFVSRGGSVRLASGSEANTVDGKSFE